MIVLDSVPGTGKTGSTRQEASAGELPFGDEKIIPDMTGQASTKGLPAEAPDVETGSDLVHAEVKALGFEWMAYIRLSRIGDKFHIRDFIQTYAARHWSKRYLDEGYLEIDPCVHVACRQETPLVWDLPLLAAGRPLTPLNWRRREFLAAADTTGVRSGVAFGIADPNGIDHAVLSFCSPRASRAWIADSTVGQCYAAGLKWHELLGAVASPPQPAAPDVELSDIQRSALELMINGLSSKEIGEALNTSVQNVDYHIRELRRKFGARNRVQLAYAAGRLLAG
jgi:DNA-binding CsgD family transcriptional regulator